jgi:ABC-type Fe3+-hydroxamate transport system substrate-binding protein
MRIVSLVPSVTESLLAWGIEPVACTRFCEQPDLRHVGGTKDPDIYAIAALMPDLVVVDREENRKEDADALQDRGIVVMDLHVVSVESAIAETERLAGAVGVTFDDADPLVSTTASNDGALTAVVPIWRTPWMTINGATYGASLLGSIGIRVSHADASESYPMVSPDALAATGASIVLLPTEPYAFAERHVPEIRSLTGIDDVRIVDGKDLFWWGVRTPAARTRLAGQLADLLG